MTDIISSILLGIVQGITEWLPISSTAHLLLAEPYLPLALSASAKEFFFVGIQFFSILAVGVLYFKDLSPFTRDKTKQLASLNLWGKIIIATIPAGVMGILLDDMIVARLQGPMVIASALAFYGLLYIILEKRHARRTSFRVTDSIESLTYRHAFLLGLFQVLALIPGTSRSGSTVLGGLIIGLSRPLSANFSFFMAIPVIAGATLLKMLKLGLSYSANEWMIMLAGGMTAFLVSLIVMKRLRSFLKTHTFIGFGYYRIALALLILIAEGVFA